MRERGNNQPIDIGVGDGVVFTQYDDAHRGIVVTDGTGRYRFESNFPGGDGGFRPHIHLRVAVPGYRPLVTIYLPQPGTGAGTFDIVLEPEV